MSDGNQRALARLPPNVSNGPDRLGHHYLERACELRFLEGMSVDETAEVLRVSSITVMRESKSAKAWLYRELAGPISNGQRALESRR